MLFFCPKPLSCCCRGTDTLAYCIIVCRSLIRVWSISPIGSLLSRLIHRVSFFVARLLLLHSTLLPTACLPSANSLEAAHRLPKISRKPELQNKFLTRNVGRTQPDGSHCCRAKFQKPVDRFPFLLNVKASYTSSSRPHKLID